MISTERETNGVLVEVRGKEAERDNAVQKGACCQATRLTESGGGGGECFIHLPSARRASRSPFPTLFAGQRSFFLSLPFLYFLFRIRVWYAPRILRTDTPPPPQSPASHHRYYHTMSLKAELETWASALQAYEENDYEKAIDLFSVRTPAGAPGVSLTIRSASRTRPRS
jgi:hypothetical protein